MMEPGQMLGLAIQDHRRQVLLHLRQLPLGHIIVEATGHTTTVSWSPQGTRHASGFFMQVTVMLLK